MLDSEGLVILAWDGHGLGENPSRCPHIHSHDLKHPCGLSGQEAWEAQPGRAEEMTWEGLLLSCVFICNVNAETRIVGNPSLLIPSGQPWGQSVHVALYLATRPLRSSHPGPPYPKES